MFNNTSTHDKGQTSNSYNPEYDYLVSLNLYGDSGVGKSCLLLRFTDDTYTDSYISTIGVDFKVRSIEYEEKIVKLQIWDVSGDRRFRSVDEKALKAPTSIIAFDITDPVSFKNAKKFYSEEKERHTAAGRKTVIVLAGTKSDLENKRQVSHQEANAFAQECGIPYIETSAKKNDNVEMLFETLVSEYMKINHSVYLQSKKATENAANYFLSKLEETIEVLRKKLEKATFPKSAAFAAYEALRTLKNSPKITSKTTQQEFIKFLDEITQANSKIAKLKEFKDLYEICKTLDQVSKKDTFGKHFLEVLDKAIKKIDGSFIGSSKDNSVHARLFQLKDSGQITEASSQDEIRVIMKEVTDSNPFIKGHRHTQELLKLLAADELSVQMTQQKRNGKK